LAACSTGFLAPAARRRGCIWKWEIWRSLHNFFGPFFMACHCDT